MTPEEEVRRLLAAAAEPVTVPPEVAARLDDVLAGLVADRTVAGDDTEATPVVDLADRRTSRWPKLLVAAAVVSVLGVGLANVLNQTGSSMSADSAGSADVGALGGAEAAPSQDEGAAPLAPTDSLGETVDGFDSLADRRTPRLRSSSVTVDAQRIADSALPLKTADATVSRTRCQQPSTAKGDVQIAVLLDGVPATLVFRAEENGRRLTEVFGCDDAESPVLTTTVDAP